MTPAAERLAARIASREVRVGVIGLGYVGLPLALTMAEAGLEVLGFDVDAGKIDRLAAAGSYLGHIGDGRIRAALEAGKLSATTDFERLGEPDVIIVCVPTPLNSDGTPRLDYVIESVEAIAATVRAGRLVILESTTYPGTCDEVVLPILSRDGSQIERDVFLAYSPEREDPGNPEFGIASIPKVVGGAGPHSGRLAASLYGLVAPTVVEVSSTRVAEATKITENVFRAVNIALVNELKMVYDALGIDVWEVLDAAETKPFGYMRFDPGPGLGGHCIPIDPFYLAWRARQEGLEAKFIALAGEVNLSMPDWVLGKLEAALASNGKKLSESRVLVLGLAYKPDVDDPRESPAFEILDRLLSAGAAVGYHDPHIPRAPRMRSWPELPALESEDLSADLLERLDAAILVTPHAAIDWDLVLAATPLIVDTRGVYRRPAPNVVRA